MYIFTKYYNGYIRYAATCQSFTYREVEFSIKKDTNPIEEYPHKPFSASERKFLMRAIPQAGPKYIHFTP